MDGLTVRVAAACVLTVSGAVAGRRLAWARRLYARQLRALADAGARLRSEMLDGMLPLPDALERAGHPLFQSVADGVRLGGGARAGWRAAKDALTARGQALSCLTSADTAILDQLFAELGMTGLARQRIVLDAFENALDDRHAIAARQADEQAKLYQSLGLLAGLALSICLM